MQALESGDIGTDEALGCQELLPAVAVIATGGCESAHARPAGIPMPLLPRAMGSAVADVRLKALALEAMQVCQSAAVLVYA